MWTTVRTGGPGFVGGAALKKPITGKENIAAGIQIPTNLPPATDMMLRLGLKNLPRLIHPFTLVFEETEIAVTNRPCVRH
jgi:hypothetical protein